MTATATHTRSQTTSKMAGSRRVPAPPLNMSAGAVPPLSPRLQLIRACLVLVLVLSLTLVVQLVVISALQQSAAQGRAFDSFRADLARGTAPIGPTTEGGDVLSSGAPVAYLEIPSIGVSEVVGEGTSSTSLFIGPGHRRDTPLPGQFGTSVLYGHRTAYGGPFGDIDELRKGDLITVTTGQGVFSYQVLGVRYEGDPLPAPLAADGARLLLATAAGGPLLPNGVVRVDAELEGVPVVGATRVVSAGNLPPEERLMASDTRTLWALALWLQALIALSILAVWGWHRWGRAQTWVVLAPPLLLVGLLAAGEVARLLPNLL